MRRSLNRGKTSVPAAAYSDTDHMMLTAQVEEFATWAKNQVAKQAKLKPHDVPVFTSADFLAKLDDVRLAFAKVKNKKKPKPPPAPAPAVNGEPWPTC